MESCASFIKSNLVDHQSRPVIPAHCCLFRSVSLSRLCIPPWNRFGSKKSSTLRDCLVSCREKYIIEIFNGIINRWEGVSTRPHLRSEFSPLYHTGIVGVWIVNFGQVWKHGQESGHYYKDLDLPTKKGEEVGRENKVRSQCKTSSW